MGKTYVISDTLLLGEDIKETINALKIIKYLSLSGNKIILLSNRPSMCMRPICGKIEENGKISYFYIPECTNNGEGVPIKLVKDNKTIVNETLEYDFTVFGNGISIFDKHDENIYTGKFIEMSLLNKMINVFEDRNYKAANYCFNPGDAVYKFFRPDNGAVEPSDNTYGMQCGSVSPVYDEDTIASIEKADERIIGYLLNGKPCFYNRETNKVEAFKRGLVEKGLVDIDDTIFFLGDITEEYIALEYGDLSYKIGDDNSKILLKSKKSSPSLYNALNREV